jgi:hypothetical protein
LVVAVVGGKNLPESEEHDAAVVQTDEAQHSRAASAAGSDKTGSLNPAAGAADTVASSAAADRTETSAVAKADGNCLSAAAIRPEKASIRVSYDTSVLEAAWFAPAAAERDAEEGRTCWAAGFGYQASGRT